MFLLHRLATGIMATLLLASIQVIAAESKPGEKWAVLVGVDKYSYVKNLEFCGADMRSLKSELLHAGFDERQVILLDDETEERKLLPFRSNIEKQIELACANAEKGDFVLIAFSGHGVLLGKTSYLCPTDARMDDAKSLISLDWVYQQLQQSQADLRLVLVDACRNVPVELNGKRSFTVEEQKDNTRDFVKVAERLPEGVLLLNSCSEGEFAQEDKDFGHGVFMHFLLEGLRGKADQDGDKTVTLNELFRFTSRETKLHASMKTGDSQRPKLKGNLTVEALDYQVALVSASRSSPANTEKLITSRSGGMKLTLVPAGTFSMGSPPTESGRMKNESPQHLARITRPFYIGLYEITQGEYEKVMGTKPSRFPERDDLDNNFRPFFPVERVSWFDAIEFCNKLSERDDLEAYYRLTNVQREDGSINSARVSRTDSMGYRLPTVAEWEYACRSTTTTPFAFGDELNIDSANIDAEEPKTTPLTLIKSLHRTSVVGLYPANLFGLFDMHGNVWEWCFDSFDPEAYGSRRGTTKDPVVLSESDSRELRGGSFADGANGARSAARGGTAAGIRRSNIGFRIARN